MKYRHNSTIGVKERECISCGKKCFWFSKKRCKECSTIQDSQKRIEQHVASIIYEDDLADIIFDLDVIFSQYIRLSASDKDGKLKCFICGKKIHWKEAHNMHYIKRAASIFLRHDPRNNKAGCEDCNKWKDGNYIEYAKALERESPGITEILYQEGNLATRPTKSELKELISEYASKVSILKKQYGSENTRNV